MSNKPAFEDLAVEHINSSTVDSTVQAFGSLFDDILANAKNKKKASIEALKLYNCFAAVTDHIMYAMAGILPENRGKRPPSFIRDKYDPINESVKKIMKNVLVDAAAGKDVTFLRDKIVSAYASQCSGLIEIKEKIAPGFVRKEKSKP